MASLFQLFGEIFINSDDANKKIDDTTSKAEKSGTSIGQVAGNIGKVGMVIGTAAIAGVTALTGLAVKSADSASVINDASARVGVSAEEYQKWAFAAQQCGMSTETLEGAMRKSQTSFSKAKEGNTAMAESYQKLGIDISSIDSSEDAFNKTMAALAGMTDETERNKRAMEIFGKSYADLSPLLNEGADGMNAMKQEAVDLGGVMSNDAVAAGDKLGDTIDKLKTMGSGIVNKLGAAVIPIVQQVADLIIANLPMIQSLFEQLMPVFTNLLSTLMPPIIQLAQTLLPPIINLIQQLMPFITTFIAEILPVITNLLNMLLPPIMQIVEAVLPLLLNLITPLLPLLDPILQLLQPFIDLLMLIIVPLTDILNMILPPLVEILTNVYSAVLPVLQSAFEGVAGVLGGAVKTAFDGVKKNIDDLKGIFNGISSFFTSTFKPAWDGIWDSVSKKFSDIWNGLTSIAKVPINAIIDIVNGFIGKINTIKIDTPSWVTDMTGIGDFGFNIAKIAKLKVGMDYVPYDNYPALLHQGEAVLTAEQNENRRSENKSEVKTYSPIFNISITGTPEDTGKSLLEKIQKAVEEESFGKGGAPSWANS